MSCLTKQGLQANRFFQPFGSPWRERLVALAEPRQFADGDKLFQEGDPADGVWLVVSGTVKLVRMIEGGQLLNIHQARAGDFFGELAVLDEHGRSTCAEASGPVEAALLPTVPLLEILQQAPGAAIMELFKGITSQVRSSNDRFVHEVLQQERLATLGGMAASIIHDFKSPLTGVELASQLLESRYPEEQQIAHYCRSIRQQSTRMTALAQELLDFSRGKPELRYSAFSLPEFFAELEELNREYFQARRVTLQLDHPDVELTADRSRLLRVLQNLLSNSVAAFAGEPGSIEVLAREEGEGLFLAVRDDGPGIPAGLVAHIFEPFRKSEQSKGSGLGMAIAKSVVDAHGGDIRVASQPGEGCVFEIRLPLRPAGRG